MYEKRSKKNSRMNKKKKKNCGCDEHAKQQFSAVS
jgi:hypothetical protein